MNNGERVTQAMNWTNEGGRVQRRGMTSLLKERGIPVVLPNGDKMKKVCELYKLECSRGYVGEADKNRTGCCARRVFEREPDFLEQKNMLEEVFLFCILFTLVVCSLDFHVCL